MKKRVLSFLMACIMIASTFIISKPIIDVHAVENIESSESDVVITYEADLDIYNTVNGQFSILGQRVSDLGLLAVEPEPTPTWNATWLGNWIVGSDHSKTPRTEVTQAPDAGYYPNVAFTMVANGNGAFNSVVAFEAPADGVFDATAKLENVYDGDPSIVLMKEDGTVYQEEMPTKAHEIVTLTVEDLELRKGEKLLVVVGYGGGNGNRSVGFLSYTVTGTYDECPHVWGGDSKCDLCEASCDHDWTSADGTCDSCGATCAHDYSNGSVACLICALPCDHDFVTANGCTSCTLCGSIYVKHVCDVDVYKPVSGHFFIAGQRISDGEIIPVEPEPSKTWSDLYPGNWIVGSDHSASPRTNVTQVLEGQSSPLKFLMLGCGGGAYASVVGFEAPADGYFNATAQLRKVYAGTPQVLLKKEDGTVLQVVDVVADAQAINLTAENVWLDKDEKLLIVVNVGTGGGSPFVGFISYTVEGFYVECPHVWGDDSICTICGANCEHEWNGDSTCDLCGEICTHDWTGNDGVCNICEDTCEHDYTAKTGYCAICGLPCDHRWNSVNRQTYCTICGVLSECSYIKYVSDLRTTKTVDGPFAIVAYKISDGTIWQVETTLRPVWNGAAEEYWGNRVQDHDEFVTQGTEGGKTCRFDMHYRDSFNGTVAFTAPADGVFDFKASFKKVGESVPVCLTAIKSDRTVIQSYELTTGGQRIDFDVTAIKLSKGEQIVIMVEASENYTEGQRNVGFMSFEVGGLYEECPHAWNNDGTCAVCDAICTHEWIGREKICTVCGYDRSVQLAEENFNSALDNYFNGNDAEIDSVGPEASLDRFKVTMPSERVSGLEYKLFNLRFENGQVILRHHFAVTGEIMLYTFTVNGESVTPVNYGNGMYYFETVAEAGKLHVPDVITVKKGSESVDFSVSVYSYIAIALEKSTDEKVKNTMKALYDYNEALYTASGDRNLLEITVDSENVTKLVSDRPYDENKDDISLILVVGQSNFTTMAGYRWEYGHYTQGKTALPESPIVPAAGTAYSFSVGATSFELTDDRDMSYLSSPDRKTACVGGVTPALATKWNELTGTTVVFVQAAVEATGVHEWTPNPEDYTCNCTNYGQGVCYKNAVTTYKNAYAALSESYNIVYTGYIFNQGEHDEADRAGATVCDPQSYYDAYKSMHDGFMSELDLDFGGISVVRANSAGDTKEASSSYTKARYAQYKLCNDIDNLYMISTVSETCSRDMMDLGNSVHYSQAVFNDMGTDIANNLYSRLGLGETNAYEGIKLINKNGYLITHIDADGELASGVNVIDAENTDGRVLVRTAALGRDDSISYKLTVSGVDYSQYVDCFGLIDWEGLKEDLGVESLKVKVNVK